MSFYQSGNARGEAPEAIGLDRSETLIEALRWMTVYEGAAASAPRNRLKRAVKRNGELLSNSGSLMATSVVTSALGFAYWWFAARAFPQATVGSASAAIAAMTLVATLGMMGLGTLLLSELPKMRAGQWRLISASTLAAAAAAAIIGVGYVVLALTVAPGLRTGLESPYLVAVLVAAMAINAATLVLDEGLVGLLFGHLQLLRNAYFAAGKLAVLVILAYAPIAVTGGDILLTWLAGILISLPLLWLSVRRRVVGSLRPDWRALRGLGRRAADHNMLNLALFAPGIALPIVVTTAVSPSANAAFYTASMMTAFLGMIPGALSTMIFAVASGDGGALRSKVRIGLLVALGAGLPAGAVLAVLGRPIMSLFGGGYVAGGSMVLIVFAALYPVRVFTDFYVAISRVRGHIRATTVLAVGFGVVELVAAYVGGVRGGLPGLVTWLGVAIAVQGVVTAPRVLRTALGSVQRSAGSDGPTPPVVPRPRPAAMASGGNDATALIPRMRPDDATALLPLVGEPDQTAHLPRMRESDETAQIPRLRGSDER